VVGQVSLDKAPLVALAIRGVPSSSWPARIVFFSLAFWLGNVDSLGRTVELLITSRCIRSRCLAERFDWRLSPY
jgi:hypothetical protein